jgi:hypothetical protein
VLKLSQAAFDKARKDLDDLKESARKDLDELRQTLQKEKVDCI